MSDACVGFLSGSGQSVNRDRDFWGMEHDNCLMQQTCCLCILRIDKHVLIRLWMWPFRSDPLHRDLVCS